MRRTTGWSVDYPVYCKVLFAEKIELFFSDSRHVSTTMLLLALCEKGRAKTRQNKDESMQRTRDESTHILQHLQR